MGERRQLRGEGAPATTSEDQSRRSVGAATVGAHVRRGAVAVDRVGGESVGGGRESEEKEDREAEEFGRRIRSSRIYLVGWLRSRNRTTPVEAEKADGSERGATEAASGEIRSNQSWTHDRGSDGWKHSGRRGRWFLRETTAGLYR